MKLNPEIKQLRKENRRLKFLLLKQKEHIAVAEDNIVRIRKGYGMLFVCPALEKLGERERYVIEHRFGIITGVPETLEKVAVDLNLTRERIRQIEAKALAKIRDSYY